MDVHLVTVKTYADSFMANLALAKLDAAGIQATIINDETVLIDPSHMGSANIRLMVNEDQLDEAIDVLQKQ